MASLLDRAVAWGTLGGTRIIESRLMVNHVEDWSRVRSPGRARRRRAQGHRQNIVIREVPMPDAITIDGGRTLIMHPSTATLLRQAIPLDRRYG